MSTELFESTLCDRLADLWNRRWALGKAESVELYELLTTTVWPRFKFVRSLCSDLSVQPRDALHDCFVEKVLLGATPGQNVPAKHVIGYVNRVLRNYLIERLRQYGRVTGSGGDETHDVSDREGDQGTMNTEWPTSAAFERWLKTVATARTAAFVGALEVGDLILLKCWYAADPRPPLDGFKAVMKSPDYRAKRLGIKLCNGPFLDYGATRIGEWAGQLQQTLDREELLEIGLVLEMLALQALRDSRVNCDDLPAAAPDAS